MGAHLLFSTILLVRDIECFSVLRRLNQPEPKSVDPAIAVQRGLTVAVEVQHAIFPES